MTKQINIDARKQYNREYSREYMKKWRANNPDKQKTRDRVYRQKLRSDVMTVLGGGRCSDCGCDVVSVLEINHKNGGGRQETKGKKYESYLRSVRDSLDPQEKYNVLCRVCNAKHYVEEILGVGGFTVVWNK